MAPPLTWRLVHSLRVEAAKRRRSGGASGGGEELRLPEKVWGGTVEDLEEWRLGSWNCEYFSWKHSGSSAFIIIISVTIYYHDIGNISEALPEYIINN